MWILDRIVIPVASGAIFIRIGNFINSEIINYFDVKYKFEESCMSFPNKSNKVTRYKAIELKHQVRARNNSDGDMFITEIFKDYTAQKIQHEVDHLNGVHIFNKKELK